MRWQNLQRETLKGLLEKLATLSRPNAWIASACRVSKLEIDPRFWNAAPCLSQLNDRGR